MSESIESSNPQTLLDLQIHWEKLIQARINAKSGSLARNELDITYFKILPTIVAIQDEVDDSSKERLIKLALNQLENRQN